jgi:hypothetical protein
MTETPKVRTRAEAFNEWMRLYIDNPEAFAHETASVRAFLEDKADGREPTYGEECDEILSRLERGLDIFEVAADGATAPPSMRET